VSGFTSGEDEPAPGHAILVTKSQRTRGLVDIVLQLALASITPSSKMARATADGCAVVLKTPDGFLNLRDGPGMRFKVLEKLRRGDVLYIDTVECSTISGTVVCGNPKEWTHVNTVPRLDGPIREAKKCTQGWVASKYIQWFECSE
jgi:hypothetical protein